MRLFGPHNVITQLSALSVLFAIASLAGCHQPYPCSQRHAVSKDLHCRFGESLGPGCGLQAGSVPPNVVIDDGISADEAAALALWNNAAYAQLLAQLGISRAQLYNAGLITDPELVLFFPVGPKQLEFTAYQAVDALWLRPVRRRAAELDLSELSQQMVQNGLNVMRDVRVAHANLLLAQQRAQLTAEAQRLNKEIAGFAAKRLQAGDISELEETSSRIEALRAEATAAAAQFDVRLAKEQLRTLMGLPLQTQDFWAVDSQPIGLPQEDMLQLVAMAHGMRPDLRAIEIRKAAALRRVELARKQFMRMDIGVDSNAEGLDGFEAGPALRMSIPLFNKNRGNIAIAEAQVRQVDRQYGALRDQIELEVRMAVTQLQQAIQQQQLVGERILPVLAEAEELSRRNYEGGGVPYFLVLQTTGQFVDAQLRRADAAAGVRRAVVELERGIGRRLDPVEIPASPNAEIVAPERVEPLAAPESE